MEENGKCYEICIEKGREHRAVLVPERVNSSSEFFSNAYQEAKYQLREIMIDVFQNSKMECEEQTTKKRIERLHEYPNNVIAFCADRGRGKTTAMLSFSNALEALGNSSVRNAIRFWNNIPGTEKLLDAKFEVMAPIDPASMENTESVLQQILSQLFENFCRKVRHKSRYESANRDCEWKILSDKFQKCAEAIDSLYKSEKGPNVLIEDELDKIAEIGQSGKLLLLLHELIDGYLDFMRDVDEPMRWLVVQIDDADMDIARSYQILEDVRKYLGLPRVIVLMATNLQQLETTVEQHFLKEYEQGLRYTDSMITVERCHDIAVLYLEKAIPHPRRIYLPDIGETIREHVSQLRVNYHYRQDLVERNADQTGVNILSENGNYQEQLLELLYRKTGLVFTYESDYLHNLLPAHMRELCQFLPFFSSMKDVSDGYTIAVETFRNQAYSSKNDIPQHLNQWEENLKRLEFYLVQLWSAINLREGSRNLFREFVAQPENVRNLYLLRNIEDYYVRERIASENTKSTFVGYESDCREEFECACALRGIDLKSYLDETRQGEMSISYADVMGVLGVLTDLPGANRQYKFAYAVRLFYSIRFHKSLIREIRVIGNDEKSINFDTLTALLRDTLLKNGPTDDTARTPFGCWRLEIPTQWIWPRLNQDYNNQGPEFQFLRWKYKADQTIRMVADISKGENDVWRPVAKPIGHKEEDVMIFSPLYPLLAALDQFVRFKKINIMARDMDTFMAQIYIALLVCLNWDVQRVLFKKIKNQTATNVNKMVEELYKRFIADCVELIPGGAPSWLNEVVSENETLAQTCFSILWHQDNQYFYDMITTRVHPVPEIREYIKNLQNGLNKFTQQSRDLKNLISKTLTTKSPKIMSETWNTVSKTDINGSDQYDKNDVSKLFDTMTMSLMEALPSNAMNIYIKGKLSKKEALYRLLSEVIPVNPMLDIKQIDKNTFSLKRCRLTLAEIESALKRYITLLKKELDPEEENFTLKGNNENQQIIPAESYSMENAEIRELRTTEAVTGIRTETDPDAAIKTLQSLLQMGQQLLNAMTLLQQNNSQSNLQLRKSSSQKNQTQTKE